MSIRERVIQARFAPSVDTFFGLDFDQHLVAGADHNGECFDLRDFQLLVSDLTESVVTVSEWVFCQILLMLFFRVVKISGCCNFSCNCFET